MIPVQPVNEEKRLQLEAELEFQKKRFADATEQSTAIFREAMSVSGWVHKYPLQTAGILFVGGVFFANWLIEKTKHSENRSLAVSDPDPRQDLKIQ